jgi:hypothetical protein
MNTTPTRTSWVICKVTLPGDTDTATAVFESREWEALAQTKPGRFTLLRDGIADEAEAERLARATILHPRPPALRTAIDRFMARPTGLPPHGEADAGPGPTESSSQSLPPSR